MYPPAFPVLLHNSYVGGGHVLGLLPKMRRLNFGLGAETGEGYGTAFAASRQIGGIDRADSSPAGADIHTDSLTRDVSYERYRSVKVLLRKWCTTRVLIAQCVLMREGPYSVYQ